jgi:hypothetical protein
MARLNLIHDKGRFLYIIGEEGQEAMKGGAKK